MFEIDPLPIPEPDRPASGLPGQRLARGVARAFAASGHAVLVEVPLANGRRADVLALGPSGEVALVEVKSSLADFRSDHKWADYVGFCEAFWFAVPEGFPVGVLPQAAGILVADDFDAAVLRPAPAVAALPAARRRALTLRFARLAALRLQRLTDPAAGIDWQGD